MHLSSLIATSHLTGYQGSRSPLGRFISGTLVCSLLLSGGSVLRAECTDSGCDDLSQNTFIGSNALEDNQTGTSDTAVGRDALFGNLTGNANTAVGANALPNNNNGSFNTALGTGTMTFNISGSQNTAVGALAMPGNFAGKNNVALGWEALSLSVVGNFNTAVGSSALLNATGSSNIGLGPSAGMNLTSGNNNIDIGNGGVAGETGIVRLGTSGLQTAIYVAGVRASPITDALAVGVNVNGQLGVRASSARFKEAIRPMDDLSEAIYALHPVTFHYKKELAPKGLPEFGLVAEEVAKVDGDLVVNDDQGKPFSVRYEEVNAMLLNEFLKEHRKVELQEHRLVSQEARVQAEEETIRELLAGVTRQEQEIDALRQSLATQGAQMQTVNARFGPPRVSDPAVGRDPSLLPSGHALVSGH